jgi:DNA-binding transcriptional regulator GbsR (MarR family)
LFDIPKNKPKIELKEKKPDGRYYSVVPLRAIHDKRLTRGDLINLMTLCSYCSNNGFTFVAYSTMAQLRGCSIPNIARGMKKLERFGYFEQVKKGYTGLRGSLKRVIYDETINADDAIAISNTPLEIPTQENITMARHQRTKQTVNKQADTDTQITFNDALLVVSHSLKSDSDLLRLEQLVSRGISRTELIKAFEGVPS